MSAGRDVIKETKRSYINKFINMCDKMKEVKC